MPYARQLRGADARGACSTRPGHLYAIGGFDGRAVIGGVECLPDSSGGAWASIEPMQQPREGCAAVEYGGGLFVLGGFFGGIQLNSVERYDGDRWHPVRDEPPKIPKPPIGEGAPEYAQRAQACARRHAL